MTEPMAPERLAEIEQRFASGRVVNVVTQRALLAEVRRLQAAVERDRLAGVIPCDERYTPYDFAYCEAHDRTFALGDHCDHAGLSEVDYLDKREREQRIRAIRAEDERDRLRAAVRQIADACHWSHDPSGDPEALVAHIGQLQQIADPDPLAQDVLDFGEAS